MIVWVDDMVCAALSGSTIVDRLIKHLREVSKFVISDLGELEQIIGMQVTRDRAKREIRLSQSKYVRVICEQCGYAIETGGKMKPPAKQDSLTKDMCAKNDAERKEMLEYGYRNRVGSAMFAACLTRVDIAQAVGALCQFMHDPGPGHESACDKLYDYLRKNPDRELVFGGEGASPEIVVH